MRWSSNEENLEEHSKQKEQLRLCNRNGMSVVQAKGQWNHMYHKTRESQWEQGGEGEIKVIMMWYVPVLQDE